MKEDFNKALKIVGDYYNVSDKKIKLMLDIVFKRKDKKNESNYSWRRI